ncbi:MAG: reverse transcriptase domain-containing protein [Muribaculaceae bacterium]
MNKLIYPLDNLMSEISTRENVEDAFDYVVSHLECKEQREKYQPQRGQICDRLQQELADGRFRITEFNEMEVMDGPKVRRVQAPRVYGRIGCHAVMVIIEKYTYTSLIKNTAASIKGRGMHWLHHIVESDIKNVPEETKYYYQCDVYHFYDSINQEKMKALIKEYVSDTRLLPIVNNFIELLPSGLSKGLRSSQCFANLFLNRLDHLMNSEVHTYELEQDDGDFEIRYLYYRYCDDIVILARDKKELWRLRNILIAQMDSIGLRIKPNEAVRPLNQGLDYLGYVHYGTHSLIRKRTKQNAARGLSTVKSRKRRQEIKGSFKGMACHCDSKHLYYILTGERMKKFNELGITYTPKDGKKRFAGNIVRLATIQNIAIEVQDFEKDVRTSQGEGRYLVSFRDKQTGVWAKFFTASEEMKSILDQVGDTEDGFPFETVIMSEQYDGNKVKYRFT